MNNAVFRKTMENLRKHRDIKLFATERRRKYLVSESVEYHATKFFAKTLLSTEIKKNFFLNKSVNLGFSIVESSKTLMRELCKSKIL